MITVVILLTNASLLLPVLIAVAFVTIAERKGLAAMQRRTGPNTVGAWGLLQPFADALKLIIKEVVLPSQAISSFMVLAPVLSLVCSLLGYGVIPYGPGRTLFDTSLGILVSLAVSSLSVYGVLYAGWGAANSYAFLGALRSTAQMISYELSLGTCILGVVAIAGSYSLTEVVESQSAVWLIVPLLPLAVAFHVSALAETNRVPFDLPEAESELVAGYMTEHSAMPFVLFFLSEYGALLLMSTLTSVLFFGGYSVDHLLSGFVLGLKASLMVFLYIWARGTLPRLRYDQLIVFGWTQLLPLAVAIFVVIPTLLVAIV